MRMVLPRSQSLLIDETASPNVDDSTVPSLAHHPVRPAVVEPVEWEVDQILECRRFREKLRYLVAWQGYPPSWQPSKNLKNCGNLVRAFHDRKRMIQSNTKKVVG